MRRPPTLAILPSLRAIRLDDDRLVLSRRFVAGMQAFQRFWDGRVMCIIEPAPPSTLETNLDRTLSGDNYEVDPAELPFELVVLDFQDRRFATELARADVASAAVYYRHNHVSAVGRKVGTAVVYASEYTLRTRLQIARADIKSPVRLAKRVAWELNQERLHRESLRLAQGLHANGVPTFEVYRDLTPNSMLYFDGRLSDDMLIDKRVLEARIHGLLGGRPLRLAWHGRLNRMKGSDQLVLVGKHLRQLGVDFTLEIFGGGVLEDELRETIQREQLQDHVKLMGFWDFKALAEYTQQNHDLWVCCHPQGDPSGAYLETLGNGLPIVGYANEALAGILSRVNAGRVVPIYHAESLAKLIRDVSRKRRQLAEWARTGVSFARNHTFDKSFERRIQHYARVRDQYPKP